MEVLTALAKTPMSSGNWCVSMASMAVKEQRPAVKRMKKGSSFFGYTDTSWKAAAVGGKEGELKSVQQSRTDDWCRAHACGALTGQELPVCCFCASWVWVK